MLERIRPILAIFGKVFFVGERPGLAQVAKLGNNLLAASAALENAGSADREAVAEALRTLDEGPSPSFPGGALKFNEQGRREGAGLTIIQWQHGVPVTVHPPELAVSEPIWPAS
jgi:hypothetical protein